MMIRATPRFLISHGIVCPGEPIPSCPKTVFHVLASYLAHIYAPVILQITRCFRNKSPPNLFIMQLHHQFQ